MRVNLADYPPGCGKTLILKQSRLALMPMALFFLGLNSFMMYSLVYLSGTGFSYILGLLIELILFPVLSVYLLGMVDPMIGSVALSEEGLTLCIAFKRELHFKWEEISDIHLEYQGRLDEICFLAFTAKGKKGRGCCLTFKGLRNKKEFVELVKQWQQYYSADNSVPIESK